MFAQHPKSLALGQIIDNTRASSTCLRAVVEIFWSLHDAQSRRFGCPRLPLAAAAQARTVWILSGTAADVNVVNLHRAGQRLLARDQKTEGMTHTPCGRLADPDRLGQPNRGDAFVRLQDEPKPREPNAERQLGGMQRGARGNGELRAALAARALIEARARLPALITPGQRDRLPKSACWTDPAAWPDHSFHEPTTLILVRKRFNHVTDGRNLRQARARIVGHRVLPADHQAHHGQVQGRVQGGCCLWLIKAKSIIQMDARPVADVMAQRRASGATAPARGRDPKKPPARASPPARDGARSPDGARARAAPPSGAPPRRTAAGSAGG